MDNSLSEQEIVRRKNLTELNDLGINPYPAPLFNVTNYSKNIKNNYKEGLKVTVAGRIMSRRIMGKASFTELQDCEGKSQV